MEEFQQFDNFWSVLEEDLSVTLPNYIKFILNVNGFGNALSIMDIDDEILLEVEKSVRTQFSDKRVLERLDEDQRMNCFGRFYACEPEKFQFQHGEKKLIKVFADRTKMIIDEKGLKYFQDKNHCIADIDQEEIDENRTSQLESPTHKFLNRLLTRAKRNHIRSKNGYRYDDDIKYIASYIRMIGGPLTYETIQQNLSNALPSLSSTNRYIRKTHSQITEAVLRCDELLLYLTKRNSPLIVSISEDATRIVDRIQYDRSTNQVVGFTLPLHFGMPVPFSFPARSFEEIVQHFTSENPTSSFMNAIMAQPLADVPPFCLLLFGTDNKYDANDVIMRWRTMVKRLRHLNIEVLTISTDSDPRYNTAMRRESELGKNSKFLSAKWFACGATTEDQLPIYIQDTIHIGTKLRNFILRTLSNRKIVPFGNYFIKVQHLYTLMDRFPKDSHQLTKTVLNPKDKQNFNSVLKICNDNIVSLLLHNVVDSDGTAKYLEIVRLVVDSMLDKTLKPLERVRKIWYAVFMVRIWRQQILADKNFTMKDSFLTSNCFSCIELNAHGLVKVLLHLGKINAPELFIPYLLASQPCESLFRQTRSFTTTYSTVVNFSVKEMLDRINRIELQYDIANRYSETFVFPRLGEKRNKNVKYDLPTEREIFEEIELSRKEAIEDAKELGFKIERNEELSCPIKPLVREVVPVTVKPIKKRVITMRSLKFKNAMKLETFSSKCSNNNTSVDEMSQYVELKVKEKRIVLKKTYLCWLLRDDCTKLSSNRLERVKQPVSSNVRGCTAETFQIKPCLMYRYKKPKITSRKYLSR